MSRTGSFPTPLPPTLSADYARDGYVVLPGLLSDETLALLQRECDRAIVHDAPEAVNAALSAHGRIFAYDCQRRQPALRPFLFGDLMATLCRSTIADTAYFFLDQFVVKLPHLGAGFGWHQDSAYVSAYGGPPTHRPYLTCWMPLDDVTVANGTLYVLPGTHRRGILPHAGHGRDSELVHATAEKGLPIELPAGSMVIFSSLLLHATGANQTAAPRRAYIAQYTSEVLLNLTTLQLRRNAVPILIDGQRATLT